MRFDADVAIVGGGPAGSATALALAFVAPELASRTVVLEKARYPRDKPCAGAIGARGDALLREIGVHVRVPSVAIDGVSFRASLGSAVAAPGKIGRVVRRLEFDHALALAAAARGVEVRDGVTVDGLSDEGTQGVLLRTSAGPLRTRVAVGCDGVGSVIRKDLGVSAGRLRAQVIEVDTEPVEGDADSAGSCISMSATRASPATRGTFRPWSGAALSSAGVSIASRGPSPKWDKKWDKRTWPSA